ncbi:MAG: hypothetical protein B6245_02885 [Desulfobacteraceae bacterium 4572_88]|nr:MAG: hypothetical protein B6245_02885 [Desulfobacteraceae bacterium 4572_88]
METAVRYEPVPADYGPHYGTGDEYYYGYRMSVVYDGKGVPSYGYRPLTPDDLLEPEEGDVYMQGHCTGQKMVTS